MENTKVLLIESKKELDKFLSENDVLNVQAIIVSDIGQSFLRDGGIVSRNNLIWSVWYSDSNSIVKEIVKMNKNQLEMMKEYLKIQGYDGNWDYDEYMHGMYNGMELMMAITEKREPIYREKPKQWLKDKEVKTELIKMS